MREENDRIEDREKAIRIFEALSGVDSELLKRSEKPSGGERAVLYRWGRTLAACFCLIVVGALAWAGNGRWMKYANGTGTSQNGAMPLAADQRQEEMQEEAAAESSMIYDDMNEGGAMTQNATTQDVKTQDVSDLSGGAENGVPRGQKYADEENKDAFAGGEESCLPEERTMISLEEARTVELLGDYIPERLPDGYLFEAAGLEYDAGLGKIVSLWARWSKGMDDIFLSIRRVDSGSTDAAEVRRLLFADVNAPETYDVHLYEIPYADTVPEEYREVFDNPVFMAEELTPELIQARMKTVEDAGDTDTPRGRFGVLYGDVLVQFRGELLPEQVWELFCQME